MKRKIVNESDIDLIDFDESNETNTKNLPVDKQELYNEFVKYKAMCKEAEEQGLPKPKLTDKIGLAILKIVDLTCYINTNKLKFLRYSELWKDNMKSYAVEICCRYVSNFDPDESKEPFSYIQKMVINAFLQVIKREKQNLYFKYKLLINNNGFAGEIDDTVSAADIADIETHYADDIATDYIHKFEKSKRKEREKYRKKADEKKVSKRRTIYQTKD